jgi:hypothetical protein
MARWKSPSISFICRFDCFGSSLWFIKGNADSECSLQETSICYGKLTEKVPKLANERFGDDHGGESFLL